MNQTNTTTKQEIKISHQNLYCQKRLGRTL